MVVTTPAGWTGTADVALVASDGDGGTAQQAVPFTVVSPAWLGAPTFAVGSDVGAGTVGLYYGGQAYEFLTPFGAGFRGGVRVASGDFNADGVIDYAFASGPGREGQVRAIDGRTHEPLFDMLPFGGVFTRGVLVAAGDLNADGRDDLVITAEQGGGARVRVFTATSSGFSQRSDFIALIGSDGVADTRFRGGSTAGSSIFSGMRSRMEPWYVKPGQCFGFKIAVVDTAACTGLHTYGFFSTSTFSPGARTFTSTSFFGGALDAGPTEAESARFVKTAAGHFARRGA